MLNNAHGTAIWNTIKKNILQGLIYEHKIYDANHTYNMLTKDVTANMVRYTPKSLVEVIKTDRAIC